VTEHWIRFALDVAPQVISIVIFALYSWHRLQKMDRHMDEQDEHLDNQDLHLINNSRHLRTISNQLTKLTGESNKPWETQIGEIK